MSNPSPPLVAAIQQEAAKSLASADAVFTDRRQIRRSGRSRGGRRAIDQPVNAWSTGQLAYWIGMSGRFVYTEIQCGEIKASRFGTEYRIHCVEVRRYLRDKGFPVPIWMHSAESPASAP